MISFAESQSNNGTHGYGLASREMIEKLANSLIEANMTKLLKC